MSSTLPILTAANGLAIVQDVVVGLVAALALGYAATRLKLPALVGFLIAGALIGPGAFGLIASQQSIEVMANIGVVFLLFTIGLKFSVKELVSMKGAVFGAGSLQVVLTLGVAAVVLWLCGMGTREAVLTGILIALSSTAILIKVIEERGQAHTPHGRLAVGVLIFQDIAAILFILLLPVLGGGETEAESTSSALISIAKLVVQSLAMLALVLVASRVLLPKVFGLVVAARSQEIFSLATIVIIIGTAYVSGLLGVSLALGAFAAGMVVADSDVSRQVLADVRPIRDTLGSLFFVSIGLMIQPGVWAHDWALILALTAAAIAFKAVVVGLVGLALGHGTRTSVLAGLGLAQIGEFSFVLAQDGVRESLLSARTYELFIAVSVLSMALTPFVVAAAPWIAARLIRVKALRSLRRSSVERELGDIEIAGCSGHVIVVGYGVNGRNVTRMLRTAGVTVVVIELNAHTVRRVRAEGGLIFYGDASRPEVLVHAGVKRARAVVVAMPDAAAVEAIVEQVRALNPASEIVVRTRFVREVEALYRLGATVVVPEEFESSLELAGQALRAIGADDWAILQQQQAVRDDHYRLLIGTVSNPDGAATGNAGARAAMPLPRECTAQSYLPLAALTGIGLSGVTVGANSPVAGKTVGRLDFRRETGALIVAVHRAGQTFRGVGPDFVLSAGDVLFLFGSMAEVEAAQAFVGAPVHSRRAARETRRGLST